MQGVSRGGRAWARCERRGCARRAAVSAHHLALQIGEIAPRHHRRRREQAILDAHARHVAAHRRRARLGHLVFVERRPADTALARDALKLGHDRATRRLALAPHAAHGLALRPLELRPLDHDWSR